MAHYRSLEGGKVGPDQTTQLASASRTLPQQAHKQAFHNDSLEGNPFYNSPQRFSPHWSIVTTPIL